MLGRLANWLFSIRLRLLLVNALIVAVPLIGVGFARFYEREMLRTLEHDMIHQGELLRQILAADPLGVRLSERTAVLAAAAARTRTRIRLLDHTGALMADSHAQGPPEGPEKPAPKLLDVSTMRQARKPALSEPPEPQDVSQRPEVQKALSGHYGATTRFWKNRDRLFLFSALPILRENEVVGVVYATRSTNPVRAAMYRLRTTLIKILLAALAATVALSLFLSGTISRPLSRLTKTARRIAAGDRSGQLSMNRRDEIGQLAKAFDAMTRKLDERSRATAELAATISHEFKSPLTSIRGAAELLAEGAADDPAARERFLNNILTDAHRLDRLVTRLLELSRVEADSSPAEVIDYEALVRKATELPGGQVAVIYQYRSKRTQLRGRADHLTSVLRNLIDNAQQHANAGTQVTVRVVDGPPGMLRTSVHNLGPVISESQRERIWERFATTRGDCGGTGLGLAIVAAVVRASGGSVNLSSSDADGTIFTFDLPTALS